MDQETMQYIENLIRVTPGADVALALHDCQSGAEWFLRAHEPFHPASTFKICVMMEAYHQSALGALTLDEQVAIANDFSSIADGSRFSTLVEDDSETSLYARIGQSASLRELINLMITRSSNFATNLLIKRVTAKKVTAYMRELGTDEIVILRGPEDNRAFALGLNNSVTAHGLAHLLRLLAEGRVVSNAASDEMLEVMIEQVFNEGIPAGLPEGMKVAHKTGWNERMYHDAGIIFPPGREPYCLVVLTRGIQQDADAHALVAEISRLCYQGLVDN